MAKHGPPNPTSASFLPIAHVSLCFFSRQLSPSIS